MSEFRYPIDLKVLQIGHLARSAISCGARSRIEAVFENSFYIATAGPWLCVTGPFAAIGPLSLRCEPPRPIDWRNCGIRTGMAVLFGQEGIYLPPLFQFPFIEASVWAPPAVSKWSPGSLRRGLRYFATWLQQNPPASEGLSCLLLADSENVSMSTTARQASEALEKLRVWLHSFMPGQDHSSGLPLPSLDTLPGLGPGLTPSGDDFLGGTMVALRLLGYPVAAGKLFDSIVAEPAISSNPISQAHLSAAAQGSCNAWIHTVLNAILGGDIETTASNLDKIGRIGHTSGWDTLAGALTVLAAQAGCSDVVR